MTATIYETPNEKAISGALALVMHALFFAMLVLSVNWQRPEPAAMVAELWSNLPSPKADVPPPPPPAPPKVEPEPPKPQPKVEPKPEPKAEIDLREKKEKERKTKEEAVEKKKLQEKELAEKKKREEQDQKTREAAEAKRLAKEQSDALKNLAQQQAAEQSQQSKEIEKYRAAIAAKIKRFIVEPPNVQGNPVTELAIVILPGGEVFNVTTKKSSGQTIWDNACERAIRRAQPLPLPPADSLIFKEFRELTHSCRYKE
jgi:colicin import membrane protein